MSMKWVKSLHAVGFSVSTTWLAVQETDCDLAALPAKARTHRAGLDTQLRREGGEMERERGRDSEGSREGRGVSREWQADGGGAKRLRAQEADRESAEGGQCRVSPMLEVNVQGWSVPFILSVSTVSRAAQRLCLLVGLLCSFLFYKCHPLIYTIQYIYRYILLLEWYVFVRVSCVRWERGKESAGGLLRVLCLPPLPRQVPCRDDCSSCTGMPSPPHYHHPPIRSPSWSLMS